MAKFTKKVDLEWTSDYVYGESRAFKEAIELSKIYKNAEIKSRLFSDESDADVVWEVVINFSNPEDEAEFIMRELC